MKQRKKSWADRWDGYRIRGLDPVHVMMPYMFGSRIENEAVLGEVLDLTEILNSNIPGSISSRPQSQRPYF